MLSLAALVAAGIAAAAPPFYVPTGTETMNLGGVTVSLRPALPIVERATSMPVVVHVTGPVTDKVVVWGCLDWTCSIHEEHEIPPDTDTVVALPMWSQTLQVRARMGDFETSCCRQPDRPIPVVLVAGTLFEGRALEAGVSGAATTWVVGVGDALREHPALIDTVRMIVAPTSAVLDAAALQRVEAGGGAVVRIADDVDPAAAALSAVEARNGLVAPNNNYEPPHVGVLRAAAAATAQRPSALVELGVVFIGLAIGVGAMWRARTRGWRAGLAIASGSALCAGLVALALAPLLAPAVAHERVIAWVGDGGWMELGVDAARPRAGTEEVVLRTDAPLLGVTTLGDRGDITTASVAPDRRSATVLASTDVGAGALWRRPAPHPNAVRVVREGSAPREGVVGSRDVVENGLGEPLAFLVFGDGERVARDVPPGGRVDREALKWREPYQPMLAEGMRPAEERLAREVLQQCRATTANACGVALLRRPHEIVAIEVRP